MTRDVRTPFGSPAGAATDETDRLLETFVDQPVPPMAPAEAREMRARVVGVIDVLQSRPPVRRSAVGRRRAVWVLGGAAAAGVALVLARDAWKAQAPPRAAEVVAVQGASQIEHAGNERLLADPASMRVAPGDEIRTGPQARASAVLATGAAVDIGPASRLRFAGRGDDQHVRDRIDLLAGRIDVQVPKLAGGDEVRVVTDDATIVVHGTKFSVERTPVEGGHAAGTRVSVSEGRVGVYTAQGERLLSSGADWNSAPADASPPDAPAPSSTGARGPAAPPDAASTLKAENAVLGEAMRLVREHRDAQALARLDDLLTRYPSSPLAETARVARLRILQSTGASAALRRDGESYLADYPNGFARQEVARLLAHAKTAAP